MQQQEVAAAETPTVARKRIPSLLEEPIRFGFHLLIVYIAVWYVVLWVIGRFYAWILPLYQHPVQVSSFQFTFSHLFEFYFGLGFLGGFVNAKYRHKAAQFVWIVPTAILGFKISQMVTPSSVLTHSRNFGAATQYYFGRTFFISEWHSWGELFAEAGNPDMGRGMQQLRFTAPFFAAAGYSVAAFICLHTGFRMRVIDKLRNSFSREALNAPEDD